MLVAAFTSVSAGSINKKFIFFSGSDGTLFYIKPQKMPKADGSAALRKLKYDITTMASEDSVSITAFVYTRQRFKFDEATILNADGSRVTSKIETIFIKPKSTKKYINRLRFWMKRKDFDKLFETAEPFMLDYGYDVKFKFSPGKWEKLRKETKEIFLTIDTMAK